MATATAASMLARSLPFLPPNATAPAELKFGGHRNFGVPPHLGRGRYELSFFEKKLPSKSPKIHLKMPRTLFSPSKGQVRAILYKHSCSAKTPCCFFANSISATRLIINQLFVVVLSRFRILVRVGPERRGATNEYLW